MSLQHAIETLTDAILRIVGGAAEELPGAIIRVMRHDEYGVAHLSDATRRECCCVLEFVEWHGLTPESVEKVGSRS